MSRRSIHVWRLVALCLWGLSVLVVSGNPVSAHGGGHRETRHTREVVWSAHYFAPYNNDAARETDLVALSQASGARFFTLAFIESSKGKNCQATWNTRQPIGSWMRASIDALRATGGDVRMAFGGSFNSELAVTCHSLPDLEAQYQAVIDTYNLTHIDFDIEGKTLRNTRATDRRNQAIAALQQRAAQAGRRLNVSYTLPVEVTGLSQSDLNLLRDAIQNGVQVSVVNLMTMDYYSKHAQGDQMGQNAITTANSVFRQLQQLYPAQSSSQLWSMIGLTPMIGVNDDTNEIFTMQDAQTVVSFARQQRIPQLAFWSMGRDRACTSEQTAPHGCSGVDQRPYNYAQAFAAFGP
jgi:chitinase